MVRNSLVLWFFCQPLRPLRKRWQLSTLDVRVSCVFWVSGQKSHHQNNEDVHGQVCHCEFHFTFTGESCGLMGKWKEKVKSQWRGFHCVLLWITQSFNSKYFMHLSSCIMAVQSQEMVMWAQVSHCSEYLTTPAEQLITAWTELTGLFQSTTHTHTRGCVF